MILTQAKLKDIPKMREILQPEVDRGVILERSDEVMANMIRSYRILWEEEKNLKNTKYILENKDFSNLENPIMLGFCALHIHSPILGEVRSLIVGNDFQRRGCASVLIQNCLKEGEELGLKEILVLTYKRALFKKLGFVEISKDKIPNQKIWADCILCKHFPLCDEIALIKAI